MKAITVRQPWASLIAVGEKTVENRSRGLAYRGPIAIHAGREWLAPGLGDIDLVRAALQRHGLDPEHRPDGLPSGAVVALAELVDCHPGRAGMPCCPPWGGATHNGQRAVHLVLAQIRPLAEPIPARGQLGLWEWVPPAGVETAAGQPP